jgi:hypothetical protein
MNAVLAGPAVIILRYSGCRDNVNPGSIASGQFNGPLIRVNHPAAEFSTASK